MKKLLSFLFIGISAIAFAQTPQFVNTATVGSGNAYPFNSTTYGKCQFLIDAGQYTGATTGQISKIYIKAGSASSSATYFNLTIKIGYTSLTALTSGPWITTGMKTYYYSANTTFNNVVVNGWIPITLQTPFFYNPYKSIIIEFGMTGSSGTAFSMNCWSPGTGNKRMYGGVSSASSSGADGTQSIVGIDITPQIRVDAGIYSINKPAGTIIPGIDTVKCTLMSFGRDSLDTSEFGWSVNGAAQTPPSNWSGPIGQLQSYGPIKFGTYNFTTGINTVKAWTKNPNNIKDSNALNDTASFSFYTCNPLSGTYIIDATGTGNYRSFNEAVDWIKNCGVSGPVVFRVKSGTYNERLVVPAIPGVSSTNTVTFESYNLDSTSVTLQYASTGTGDNYVIQFTGGDFVTFRKMTLSNKGLSYGRVIDLMDGSDNITISNCIVSSTLSTATTFAGVYSGSGTINHNINISNNIFSGGYYAIYFFGASGTPELNSIIDNNIIIDFYNYGIYVTYQNDIKIRKNILKNNPNSTTVYGIYPSNCGNTIEVTGNNINVTASSSVYGLFMSSVSGTTTTYGKVYNNFVTTGAAATNAYGLYLSSCSYLNIYYNTINTYATASANRTFYLTGGTASTVNLQNNIISNFGSGFAMYVATTTIINTSNYNDLYTNGVNLGYWTSNRTDLAAWKTGSGKDANSVSVNPGFYTNTDLHVNTSGISNIGQAISGITIDIDGDTRLSTPDIGADEFDLVSSDAGVSQLVSPLTPCPGLNNVSVKIKNYGTATLDSVYVNWNVNGILQTPVKVRPALSQYQETTVSLGNYSFSSTLSYNIKSWTSNPNAVTDGNFRNDSLYVKNIRSALSGTYTIGGTSANYPDFNEAINDLIIKGVCGPTKFRVNAGIFNERVKIPSISGSSSTNTITFESFNLDSTSVEVRYAASGTGDNSVLMLDGADYIIINKITFRATGTPYGTTIEYSNGANYNRITNNRIYTQPGSTSSTCQGIYSANTTLDNYNLIQNNLISGGYYGINIQGISDLSRENINIIRGNTFIDFSNYGINLYYQSSSVIENNYFQNYPNITNSYAIYSAYNYDSAKIVKNRIQLNAFSTNYGLYVYYHLGTSVAKGLIANNTISQTGPSTGTNYGIYMYNSNYQNFCYNSINITAQSSISRAMYVNTGSKNTLLNNNFVNNGTGYSIYIVPDTTVSRSDYNNLYTRGSVLGFRGTDFAKLSNWKSGTPYDSHSVSVNPYFYSNTDLHVYSGYLNNAGIKVASVVDDVDGQPRNNTTPDIGADEFTVYQYDAAIIAWVNPTNTCPGVNDSVVVTLINFGSDTLKSAKIKWTINNVSQPVYNVTGLKLPNMGTINLKLGNQSFLKGVSYNMKVWADTINNTKDQSHRNDTFIYNNYQSALAGTYTIGAGKDFINFSAAATALNKYGICNSVVFNVDPGTYTEQIQLDQIRGTSPADSVTFKSATGNNADVILQYAGTSIIDNYVVAFNGADYVRFEKMTIRSVTTLNFGYVITFKGGSHHNVIDNNRIICPKSTSSSVMGIYATSVSNDEYNTFSNNIFRGGCYGVYWMGLNATSVERGNTFKNNLCDSFYSNGFALYYQDSIEVSGNSIINTGLTAGCYGMYCINFYYNSKIINNLVKLSGSSSMYGIYVQTITGTFSKNPLIANNMISLTGTSTGTVQGLYLYGGYYNKIYHNSINITCGSSSAGRAVYFSSPSATGYGYIDFQNNIVSNLGSGYAIYVDAAAASSNYLQNSDYNDLYSAGMQLCRYGATDLADISAWKSIVKKDLHSISLLPPYVSNTDLHLSGFTGFTMQNPLPEVTTDFDGDLRNFKRPAIGADERPTLGNDAGIYGINSPKQVSCDGVLAVVVNLVNYGTNNLDSVIVNWKINGVAKKPLMYRGPLPYLSDTALLLGFDTFTYGTSYKVVASTSNPNNATDLYPDNDADSIYNIVLYSFPVISAINNDTICKATTATLSVSSPNTNIFYWYDSLQGGSVLSEDSFYKTPVLQSSRTYYVEAGTLGNPDKLVVSDIPGIAEMGNMFEVQARSSDVMIDSFGIMPAGLQGTKVPVEIYYKKGTYKGYETNAAKWKLLGIDTVTSIGINKFVPVSIGKLKLLAGDTLSFYITSTDPSSLLIYTDVAKVISDKYLNVSTGTKNFYPFDLSFQSNKTWNGEIYYSTGSLCTSQRVAVEAVVKPVPAVKLPADTSVCDGAVFQLDAGSGPGFTYVWKKGSLPDTLSTSQLLTVDTTGQYIVRVDDKCGFSDTDTFNLKIHAYPVVKFSINDTTQCLRGNNFIFTNSTTIPFGSVSGYLWKFGEGSSKPDTNTYFSYLNSDTFTVTLSATSDFGCVDSHKVDVIVFPQPAASFSINDTNQCFSNNYFDFTNSSSISSGSILLNSWYFGDGNSANSLNSNHSYSTDDTFNVKLWILSDKGCDDSIITQVIVYPQPKAGFTVNDSNQCLTGNSFIFTNTSIISSGSLNYTWKTGDGNTATTTNHTYSYSKTGIFNASLIAESGFGCKDSVTSKIYVVANPFINLGNDTTIKNPANLVLNAGSSYDSVRWSNNATTTSITVDSATWGGLGVKPISITVYKNGCSFVDNISVTIISSVGIDEAEENMKIKAWPNPVKAIMNIEINDFNGPAEIILTDLLGHTLYSKQMQLSAHTLHNIDLSGYQDGIYILKVVYGSGSKLIKVVKE